MANNYYDRVLQDFGGEGIFDDSYDEGILDDSYDEGVFDEASRNDRRRPRPISNLTGKSLGRSIPPSPSSGNYATKAELKSSLNVITQHVDDLKKSSISLASSIKRLDDGYEKVVKALARKAKTTDSTITNSSMMAMLGAIINKPTLNAASLQLQDADGKPSTSTSPATQIGLDSTKPDPIQIDLTKTLLFTMMPMMMSGNSSSGGDNSNMMMMMMMVLLLQPPNNSGTSGNGGLLGSGSDNSLVLIMVMMMMMNKK